MYFCCFQISFSKKRTCDRILLIEFIEWIAFFSNLELWWWMNGSFIRVTKNYWMQLWSWYFIFAGDASGSGWVPKTKAEELDKSLFYLGVLRRLYAHVVEILCLLCFNGAQCFRRWWWWWWWLKWTTKVREECILCFYQYYSFSDSSFLFCGDWSI